MKKIAKSTPVLIAAIAGITIVEVVALLKGIDGILLTMVVAALAAVAGVKIRDYLPSGKD